MEEDSSSKATMASLETVFSLCRRLPLIVVSNREPYEHRYDKGTIRVLRPAGGLVSALDPVLQTTGGTWIAWGSGSADRDTADADGRLRVPPEKDLYTLQRIWLTPEEVKEFYEGHVNQTLWPLCHSQMNKVRFSRREWDTYQRINRRFAESSIEHLKNGKGIVWFQDYQFATAPGMLRSMAPDALIAQFWHIPWPPFEIFRTHPQRRALLEGMLGCDLIGMHIDLFCKNFLECVQQEFGYPIDEENMQVIVGNRTVHVVAEPISIDAAHFEHLARSKRTERSMELLRATYQLHDVKVGIGVERADYTKGILERLRAIEYFFDIYPAWRSKFTFIQIGSPSRSTIPAYARFWAAVQAEVKRINKRFATTQWRPIVLVQKQQTHAQLSALYRMADLAIVSSTQDGMNLVAKEYVASQVDLRGTLVLSEFAGASEEMEQALLINPYDMEGFASAIDAALRMKETERKTRMRRLRNHLFDHTIDHWIASMFQHIQNIYDSWSDTAKLTSSILDNLDVIVDTRKERPFIELFCDYDGVLSPISPRPEDATLDETMAGLLIRLRDYAGIHVNVVSGRSIKDISQRIGIERLTYAGNHGLEIHGPRIERMHPSSTELHRMLRKIYQELRKKLRSIPGAIVEHKELSLTIHYRLCEQSAAKQVVDTCYNIFETYAANDLLQLTTGKKVVEFRPNVDWNKGKAVEWILEQLHGPDWQKRVLPIYLGDDETDEDAFRILDERGIGIHVGDSDDDTCARYRLADSGEVAIFFDWLLRQEIVNS